MYFFLHWIQRLLSSDMWCHVVWYLITVSATPPAPILNHPEETTDSSKMLVRRYQTTWYHISEGHNLHDHLQSALYLFSINFVSTSSTLQRLGVTSRSHADFTLLSSSCTTRCIVYFKTSNTCTNNITSLNNKPVIIIKLKNKKIFVCLPCSFYILQQYCFNKSSINFLWSINIHHFRTWKKCHS